MADTCALARARLVDYVSSLRDASKSERIVTGIKAGFVGGPMTLLKQWAGNLPFAAIDQLAVKPLSVVADQLIAFGRSALGGFRVSPHELRSTAFALDPVGLQLAKQGMRKGFEPTVASFKASRALYTDEMAKGHSAWHSAREAMKGFIDELRVQLNAQEVERSLEQPDRIRMHHAWSQYATDAIFGSLEAQDRPFFFLAKNTSLWTQAKVMAMREGLSGERLIARAKALFEAPTDEMELRAYDDAMYATFKDQRTLSKMASGLKQQLAKLAKTTVDPEANRYTQQRQRMQRTAGAVANYLTETNVPFTGVPTSTAMKGIDLSPLGSLLALLPGGDQRHVAEVLSRAGVGTAMIYMGMRLYQMQLLTGPRPGGARQGQWDTERRQEFAVRLSTAPDAEWLSLKNFMPFSLPLMIGASIAQAKDFNTHGAESETTTEQALRAPFYVGRAVTSQTYLMQVQRLIAAMNDETGGKTSALLASQVPVPQLVNTVRRIADPVAREQHSLKDRLIARIPFATRTLPARTDALGRPIRYDTGPFGRYAPLIDLTQAATGFSTPGLAEMDRLGITLPGGGRQLSVPDQEGRLQPHRLTPAEQTRLKREVGPAALAEIDALVTSPDWQDPTLSDDERRVTIQQILQNHRLSARANLANELYQLSVPK